MASRNSYLTKKAMNNCLFASILTMCASQFNVTIDGIIVSNFVGPNALSATNLFTPISLAIVSLGSLLGVGGTILAARYMGQRKMDEANRTISTALTSVIVVGMCFGALSFLFRDDITDLLCSEEALKEHFLPYMSWMSGFAVITMLSSLVNQMAEIDGRPDLVTKAVVCEMLANVIMDFVFVYFLKWGIAGSAIATILSVCLNICVLYNFLRSSKCSYSLHPLKEASWHYLGENLKYGSSLIISNLVIMLTFLFLNTVTQSKQGVNGIFALAICMNLLSIGMMFAGGISTALMSIGSFLYGQHDMKGLRFLVNRSIVILEAAVLVLLVVIMFYPSLISRLFGADTPELQAYTNDALRKFVWMLPFMLLGLVLANTYQIIGRVALAPVVISTFPIVLIPCVLLVPLIMGNDNFWYSFTLTGVLVLLLVVCITLFISRKEKELTFLTLIPTSHASIICDESVKRDHDSVVKSVTSLSQTLKQTSLPAKLQDSIMHCLEELELNILSQANEHKSTDYFDVLVSHENNKILASIKDSGKPFDPVHFSEEKRGIGLKILFGYSDKVDYKYMFGQNMTFITWNKEQKE